MFNALLIKYCYPYWTKRYARWRAETRRNRHRHNIVLSVHTCPKSLVVSFWYRYIYAGTPRYPTNEDRWKGVKLRSNSDNGVINTKYEAHSVSFGNHHFLVCRFVFVCLFANPDWSSNVPVFFVGINNHQIYQPPTFVWSLSHAQEFFWEVTESAFRPSYSFHLDIWLRFWLHKFSVAHFYIFHCTFGR